MFTILYFTTYFFFIPLPLCLAFLYLSFFLLSTYGPVKVSLFFCFSSSSFALFAIFTILMYYMCIYRYKISLSLSLFTLHYVLYVHKISLSLSLFTILMYYMCIGGYRISLSLYSQYSLYLCTICAYIDFIYIYIYIHLPCYRLWTHFA